MNLKNSAALVCALGVVGTASADIWTFNELMTGLQEVPPNASPGTGFLSGTYDDVLNELQFSVTFQDLIGTTTAAHYHGPALPGVNAAVQIGSAGFPVGVTSGNFGTTHILTATQETQLMGGLWYYNIHTNVFPGGEIRAQIHLVPAPGAAALLALTGIALAGRRRR